METGKIDTSVKCFSQSINKLHHSVSRYPINIRWSKIEEAITGKEKKEKMILSSLCIPPLRTKIGKLLKYCRVQSGDEDTFS